MVQSASSRAATADPVSSPWRWIRSRSQMPVLVVERLEVDHLVVETPGQVAVPGS